ncbi:MAG: helix-turn-helix transcriptional regulator [Clostridia bacterium]|nr:helix-turn-helix transcriptional regulator [Clostridia bacterium]
MSNQAYVKVSLKNTLQVTRVATILCYELSPSFFTKGEAHDFWELVYVDRGELSVRAGERRYRLRQGEITFHQPNEFHGVECDGVSGASVFIMTFDCRSPAMRFFCGRTVKPSAELRSLIKRLIEESTATFLPSVYPLKLRSDAPVGGQQLIRLYLEELLLRLIRSAEESGEDGTGVFVRESAGDTTAQRICTYLSAHLYDRITLDMLSEVFHFGKSRLCELFKASTGDSVMHYYLGLKISEAKRLLKQKRLTVSEISERLGFESPAYFSRCFRKHVGMPPSAYRDLLIHDSAVYMEREEPILKQL